MLNVPLSGFNSPAAGSRPELQYLWRDSTCFKLSHPHRRDLQLLLDPFPEIWGTRRVLNLQPKRVLKGLQGR
jgi:hypothetical protein